MPQKGQTEEGEAKGATERGKAPTQPTEEGYAPNHSNHNNSFWFCLKPPASS